MVSLVVPLNNPKRIPSTRTRFAKVEIGTDILVYGWGSSTRKATGRTANGSKALDFLYVKIISGGDHSGLSFCGLPFAGNPLLALVGFKWNLPLLEIPLLEIPLLEILFFFCGGLKQLEVGNPFLEVGFKRKPRG